MLILKPFRVVVEGFDGYIYHARSRGHALSQAWQAYCSYRDVSFKDFLRMARSWKEDPTPRFGERLIICGEPAFYVSHDSQYIQFVRPDSDVILNAHPMDVEPPEARRGTPYYSPTPEAEGDR